MNKFAMPEVTRRAEQSNRQGSSLSRICAAFMAGQRDLDADPAMLAGPMPLAAMTNALLPSPAASVYGEQVAVDAI